MTDRKNNNLVALAKHTVIHLEDFILRPLEINDLIDYHELTSDDETLKYDYPAHKSLEESLQMLVVWNLSQPLGRYGIEQRKTGKIIGNASLRLSDEGDFCEIGYTINKKYWRQGIAYRCVSELINFAFLHLNINKVIANVHENNTPSIGLLNKLNFSLTGKKKTDSLRESNFIELTYTLTITDYSKVNHSSKD